jgi:inactivated superfamily I helicase
MIKKSRSDDQNASHRTRFPPGVSGNPNGRPKGTPNLKLVARKVFTEMVVVRDGVKTRKITRLEALLRTRMDSGLKGNDGAAQAAIKMGMLFGAFDEKEAEPVQKESPKYSVDVKKLNDEELRALERIMIKAGTTAGSGIDAAEEKPSDETCPKTSKK